MAHIEAADKILIIHHHTNSFHFNSKTKSISMTDFNPIHFLQHAWDDAHSNWGKACVVLFYLFIWTQAIWSLETVIAPMAGWDCYYQGISDYATEMVAMFARAMNVMQLGFWVYAHREGIKVWNVSMVFVFNAALFWIYIPSNFMELEGAPDCDNSMMRTITWVLFWWTLVTLVCSVLEDGSKPRRTTTETNPIIH